MLEKGSKIIVREGRHKGEVGIVEYCHYGPEVTSIYVKLPNHNDSVLFNDWSLLEEYPEFKKQKSSASRSKENSDTTIQTRSKTTLSEQTFDPQMLAGGSGAEKSGEDLAVKRNQELLSIKLLLNLTEVTELTGLTRTFLLRAIRAETLKATKVNYPTASGYLLPTSLKG